MGRGADPMRTHPCDTPRVSPGRPAAIALALALALVGQAAFAQGDPGDADFDDAATEIRLKNWDVAIGLLKKSLERSKSEGRRTEARHWLGVCHLEAGHLDEAI